MGRERDIMTLNYKLIGTRIKSTRQTQGLTQENLAEMSGISPQHVSHIENSGTKLSLPCLVSICNALNTTPNDILMDSVDNSTPQLIKEVSAVFSDCSVDEMYLMLAQAENLKKSLKLRKYSLLRE
jgi:transcriptional regulator with XRE-family HTH domain